MAGQGTAMEDQREVEEGGGEAPLIVLRRRRHQGGSRFAIPALCMTQMVITMTLLLVLFTSDQALWEMAMWTSVALVVLGFNVWLFHTNMMASSPARVVLTRGGARLLVNDRPRAGVAFGRGCRADVVLVRRPAGGEMHVLGYSFKGEGGDLRFSVEEGWSLRDLDAFWEPFVSVVRGHRMRHGPSLVAFLKQSRGMEETPPARGPPAMEGD